MVMPGPAHRYIWLRPFSAPPPSVFCPPSLPRPPSHECSCHSACTGTPTHLLLLLLAVVLGHEVKGHRVQGAGHHAERGAQHQGGVHIREEPDKSRPQAKQQIPQEVNTL